MSAFITSQNQLLTLKSRLQTAINNQKQAQGILDALSPVQEAFKQAEATTKIVPDYVTEVQNNLLQASTKAAEISPTILLLGAAAVYLLVRK